MTRYRHQLPQLGGSFFLADGGIETTLIFVEGQELPYFAAFDLLKSGEGRDVLRKYFRSYAEVASKYRAGVVLETATWRASPDWGAKLGYTDGDLRDLNRRAVMLIEEIRSEFDTSETPVVISGCVGPRGDGYVPGTAMSVQEAEDYHRAQIETFSETTADLVTAITMNYIEEAVGVTRAAQRAGMPVVISFTVETDGGLPTGHSLGEAIQRVEEETRVMSPTS